MIKIERNRVLWFFFKLLGKTWSLRFFVGILLFKYNVLTSFFFKCFFSVFIVHNFLLQKIYTWTLKIIFLLHGKVAKSCLINITKTNEINFLVITNIKFTRES